MRWGGTVERLGDVNVDDMSNWIQTLPFTKWPQQHPVDEQLRPAMVSDPNWHRFGEHVTSFFDKNPAPPPPWITNTMLSVVMPGHRIEPHKDVLGKDWFCRVHVPLVTNPDTKFIIEGKEYDMWVGSSYAVNISREHAVINNGITPRIHFMFDCNDK